MYPSKLQGKVLVKNYDLRIGGVILYIYSNIKLIIDHQNSVGDFNNRQYCQVYKSSAKEGQQIPRTVIQHF